jgi:hypothetical protein
MAIIVAAIFWSWLWGGVGLLLATPLTVCIAVVGKYLPDFSFLDVLLSDRPPIAASDRFYQRLLALDGEELSSICETYRAETTLAKTYDEVVIPALHLVDMETRMGNLDDGERREIYGLLRVVLSELGEDLPEGRDGDVLCLPASNESDELCALMLTQLLAESGVKTTLVSSKALAGEMVAQAVEARPQLVCISCLPPASMLPAQHLCRRLGEGLEDGARLFVGLWNDTSLEHARRAERCRRAHATEVFTSLEGAAREIHVQVGVQQPAAAA